MSDDLGELRKQSVGVGEVSGLAAFFKTRPHASPLCLPSRIIVKESDWCILAFHAGGFLTIVAVNTL